MNKSPKKQIDRYIRNHCIMQRLVHGAVARGHLVMVWTEEGVLYGVPEKKGSATGATRRQGHSRRNPGPR